jgi:hypothetical protein
MVEHPFHVCQAVASERRHKLTGGTSLGAPRLVAATHEARPQRGNSRTALGAVGFVGNGVAAGAGVVESA